MLGDLTLDILGTIAKNSGYEPILLLPKVLKKEPLEIDFNLNEFKFNKGDVVGFSCNVANIFDSVNLAKIISQICPSLTIIFGGPHFDDISSKIILKDNHFINYVLAGSAERNLKEFLQFLSTGDSVKVENLFFQGSDVQPTKFCKSLSQEELDHLEIPFINKIKQIPISKRKDFTVPVRTSIGCNGFCNFCYKPYSGWVGMSPQKVIKIFSYYADKGFRKFLIVDDNFSGTSLRRVEEISRGFLRIKKKFPDFYFEFDARADSFGNYQDKNFDHALIEKLIRAGLRNIFVGVESGNTEDLKYFRKFSASTDSLEQNIYFLKNIKKHSVLLTPGFIMINEDSKIERVSQNINFIDKYLPPQICPEIYWYKISFYSGAELTRKKIKELTLKKDWDSVNKIVYGQYKPVFEDKLINNFSMILDSLKMKFSGLEDELDFAPDKRDLFLKIKGKDLKIIHLKFFKKYIKQAKEEKMVKVDSIVQEHYNSVLALANSF